MPIVVNIDKCTGCESCLESCPYDAIDIKDGKATINEYCQICRACLETCPEGAITETDSGVPAAEASDLEQYKGVWVFAEQRGGTVASVAFELLGAGRKLADSLGVELCAVLLGAPKSEAEVLVQYGADKVYHSDDEALRDFNDEPYAGMLRILAEEYKPEIILAGATPIGRSFLPRVAATMRAGLTADCTSLEVDGESRNLLQTRPAFGGNIMATIVCPSRRPQIATVRPRVMKALEPDSSRSGEIVDITAAVPVSKTSVVESVKEVADDVCNIQEAEVLVAGGRGLGGENAFGMLRELAQLLDGTVAASRAAVDEGWIPYRHQVG
ncbi:MAG: 4Fe-4S dicluster domain-containing protein, partial [Anaerolineae bacterium]|nr:4Fe-4S dicluster domain-containing protein [Anaerolineae bacterium]